MTQDRGNMHIYVMELMIEIVIECSIRPVL